MILDDIIFNKRQEVTLIRALFYGKDTEQLIKRQPKPRDFLKIFKKGKLFLIAEIKKASPSAGLIRKDFDPVVLARTYEKGGAAALSVLTDEKFFQGKLEDMKKARDAVKLPVLRKDFVIDESQIYEARLAGADAVLLIARVLSDENLAKLLKLTEQLGMQALVETRTEAEVKRALKLGAGIIGINNRDLDSLKVDLKTTIDLMKKVPELKKKVVVAESGIKTRKDIEALKKAGVSGVLIGETLMRSRDIPAKIKELIG